MRLKSILVVFNMRSFKLVLMLFKIITARETPYSVWLSPNCITGKTNKCKTLSNAFNKMSVTKTCGRCLKLISQHQKFWSHDPSPYNSIGYAKTCLYKLIIKAVMVFKFAFLLLLTE